MAIRELAISDRVTEELVSTTPLDTGPAVAAANPLGKIPALLRDDAPAIYDSRVITRYLNDTHNGTLYPAKRIWEILTLEATADAIMEAAVLMTYEKRFRPEAGQSDAWITAQWGKASSAIAAINSRWMSHLSGPCDIAQIGVACALSYIDLRHDDRNWRAGNDALATWHASFITRDAMQATAPE